MTTDDAKKAGVTAFGDGRQCAPALNQKFLAAACSSDVETVALLDAYIEGWSVANLAAKATESGFHGAPSIATLRSITSAQ